MVNALQFSHLQWNSLHILLTSTLNLKKKILTSFFFWLNCVYVPPISNTKTFIIRSNYMISVKQKRKIASKLFRFFSSFKKRKPMTYVQKSKNHHLTKSRRKNCVVQQTLGSLSLLTIWIEFKKKGDVNLERIVLDYKKKKILLFLIFIFFPQKKKTFLFYSTVLGESFHHTGIFNKFHANDVRWCDVRNSQKRLFISL